MFLNILFYHFKTLMKIQIFEKARKAQESQSNLKPQKILRLKKYF